MILLQVYLKLLSDVLLKLAHENPVLNRSAPYFRLTEMEMEKKWFQVKWFLVLTLSMNESPEAVADFARICKLVEVAPNKEVSNALLFLHLENSACYSSYKRLSLAIYLHLYFETFGTAINKYSWAHSFHKSNTSSLSIC